MPKLQPNAKCNCGKDAVICIQGETDSFGYESEDMCQSCLDAYKKSVEEADHSGTCDWCKTHEPLVRPTRDYDEGSYGPVYYLCEPCIEKQEKALWEELERDNHKFDYGDYYDDED